MLKNRQEADNVCCFKSSPIHYQGSRNVNKADILSSPLDIQSLLTYSTYTPHVKDTEALSGQLTMAMHKFNTPSCPHISLKASFYSWLLQLLLFKCTHSKMK